MEKDERQGSVEMSKADGTCPPARGFHVFMIVFSDGDLNFGRVPNGFSRK